MKNILMLSALILGLSTTPVFADGHGDGNGKGRHGGGMFKKVDTDGDGFISRAEFDAKHNEKFKKMDADGDGKISQDEAKAHRKNMKEKSKERREKRQERKDSE